MKFIDIVKALLNTTTYLFRRSALHRCISGIKIEHRSISYLLSCVTGSHEARSLNRTFRFQQRPTSFFGPTTCASSLGKSAGLLPTSVQYTRARMGGLVANSPCNARRCAVVRSSPYQPQRHSSICNQPQAKMAGSEADLDPATVHQ